MLEEISRETEQVKVSDSSGSDAYCTINRTTAVTFRNVSLSPLLDERRDLMLKLRDWWRRWEAETGYAGTSALKPLDEWAREELGAGAVGITFHSPCA